MQVTVLASGSKGNAVYVEIDGVRLLVDAGISARRIRQGLAEIGTEPSALAGVLLTHEHRDHVAGLATLMKQHHLPLYSQAKTLAALPESLRSSLPADCLHPLPESGRMGLGHVAVEPFATSHDAAASCGYRICGSRTATVATDLGFVSASVQDALEGADVLVLEANYDPAMLKNGAYPWPLKQRILSNRGHLANNDAAWALARLERKPSWVVLAHLSENNNSPELARQSVADVLCRQDCGVLAGRLMLAGQSEAVSCVM